MSQETVNKLKTVCQDILICFHLIMATQTLSALYKKKTLSILSNMSIVKDNSSCSSI